MLTFPDNVSFGTANFGSGSPSNKPIGPETVELGQEYLDVLQEYGVTKLDTGRSYSNGESEKLLQALDAPSSFTISTKAQGIMNGSGTKLAIFGALDSSLDALGVPSVDTYYLHTPDRSTPISETMDAIQERYLQKQFTRFGISNLSADEVTELWIYAKSKNYILPTIYQGLYNAISRRCETELLPTLRELNISFHAYSPIACGILINARPKLDAATGRWDTSHVGGKHMHGLFNKPAFIEASRKLQEAADQRGLSPAGIVYRWIMYHSALDAEREDGIVIGASSPTQLRESLGQLAAGKLEPELVELVDSFWNIVGDDAPPCHL